MFSPFKPFLYLFLYLSILYFRPHEFVPELQGVPLQPIFLILAVTFWIWRQPKSLEAPQSYLLPVFMGLMSFSLLLTGWRGGAWNVVVEWGPVLLLYYVVSAGVDSVAKMRAVFVLLSVASVMMAIHGYDQLEQEVGWTGAMPIEGRITYLGFLNDPNDLAMSMLMTLPMTIYLSASSERGFTFRWLWRAAACIIIYGVYLTGSRGALLAMGTMFVFYLYRRFAFRGLVLGAVVAIVAIAAAPGRLSNISSEEESASGRIDAWYEGFQMLKSHPLFGVGKGLFTEYNLLTAHNSFMLALSELGLVGYFVWLSCILLTVLMLKRLLAFGAPSDQSNEDVTLPLPQQANPPPQTEPAELPPEVENSTLKVAPDQGVSSTSRIEEDVSDAEFKLLVRALASGTVGLLVCAFFLSRTYVVIVYLQIAFVVAAFRMGQRRWPELEPVRFAPLKGRLAGICLASVVMLWITTRVLM